jgi:hypothetical protein
LHVPIEKASMGESFFVEPWKAAANGQFERIPDLPVMAQLWQREGEERERGGPSRKGLADRSVERRLMASRQDEFPGPFPIVDPSLNVREKFRCALDLAGVGICSS